MTSDRHHEGSNRSDTHTVLTCRAPHPLGSEGNPRFAGRQHGVRIQIVPFSAVPTYRSISDWHDARPGCLAVRCPGCGAFTEYAIEGSPALHTTGPGSTEQAESQGPSVLERKRARTGGKTRV